MHPSSLQLMDFWTSLHFRDYKEHWIELSTLTRMSGIVKTEHLRGVVSVDILALP